MGIPAHEYKQNSDPFAPYVLHTPEGERDFEVAGGSRISAHFQREPAGDGFLCRAVLRQTVPGRQHAILEVHVTNNCDPETVTRVLVQALCDISAQFPEGP